jgi:hypothetical protein
MIMHRLLSFGSLFLFAMVSGCGGSTLDHESAVKVTNSALTATVAANAHVMASVGNGHIDVALTNPHGTGSAQIDGTVAKTGDMLSTTLDVKLDHWTDVETNITLDGALHEAGTIAVPVPLSGSVELTGTLSASGAVTGVVDFDLKGSYSPTGFSVTGHVGGQVIDITVTL